MGLCSNVGCTDAMFTRHSKSSSGLYLDHPHPLVMLLMSMIVYAMRGSSTNQVIFRYCIIALSHVNVMWTPNKNYSIKLDKLDHFWAFLSPPTNPSPFEGFPQQLKGYVALATLQRVVNVDQQVMQRHRNTIIDCLKAIDDSWKWVDFEATGYRGSIYHNSKLQAA